MNGFTCLLVGMFFSLQDNSSSDSSESEAELERLTFTLKQLIRKLHITEPVEHVLCLIGKR